jgi:hypothetical protein
MMRAYIKLDPSLPDRKDYYPDGPFRALVSTFCFAAHQPVPGTFKNERLLKVLLGRHSRHLAFLIDERDLVRNKDGSLSIVGWKEWQEGAYPSVNARIEAIEKRRRPMTPAERAFVYRMRKKERDTSAESSRDASHVTKSDVTRPLRNETKRDAARHEPGEIEEAPTRSLGLVSTRVSRAAKAAL